MVFVNGQLAYQDKQITDAYTGKVILHSPEDAS